MAYNLWGSAGDWFDDLDNWPSGRPALTEKVRGFCVGEIAAVPWQSSRST